MINKLFCKLGFHYWKYPTKLHGVRWGNGCHRICKNCKLEQTKIMYGGWDTDFDD